MRTERARKKLRLEIDPGVAPVHNELAVALVGAGAPAAAEAHFQEAIRLDPQSTDCRTNLLLLRQATEGTGAPK